MNRQALPRKRTPRWLPFVVAAIGFVFLSAAYLLLTRLAPPPAPDGASEATTAESPPLGQAVDAPDGDSAGLPYEITDDHGAIWTRPALGERPLSLRNMPTGVQAVINVRLAALRNDPEGERVMQSLGPEISRALDDLCRRMDVEQQQIAAITLGISPQGTNLPQVVAAVFFHDDAARDAMRQSDGAATTHEVVRRGDDGFWTPSDAGPPCLVYGPFDLITDIAERHGEPPPLRREMNQLLAATHETDHVTMLIAPSLLRGAAAGVFEHGRGLARLLGEFWTDDARAVFFALQLGDVAVAEARIITQASTSTSLLSRRLRNDLDQWPARVRNSLSRTQVDPYWQRLADRYPLMAEFVARQSRVATEGEQVVVSVALPPAAVHNLLLATQLWLASTARPVSDVGAPDRSRWTLEDLLAARTSVSFQQKSLQTALDDLVAQIREEFPGTPFSFQIEVAGAELQSEGITRNQQLRDFEQVDQPLSVVLTALAMRANSVKTVTRPADPDQKLVWLPGKEGRGAVLLTTRGAAKKDDLDLPDVFREP